MKATIFLLSSVVIVAATAFETPEGILNQETENRELVFSLCQKQLRKCNRITGKEPLPIQQWIAELEQAPETYASLVTDLETALSESSTFTFAPLANAIKHLPATVRINELTPKINAQVKKLGEIDTTQTADIIVGVIAIVVAILTLVGTLTGINLDLIIFLLETVAGLIEAIGSGPLALIIFIIQTIVTFITDFARSVATISSFPAANKNCRAKLMDCDFKQMLQDLVPALIDALTP